MASGNDVLRVALGEAAARVKESPAGSNNVKYWVPWGANLGAWCYAFVTWCCEVAGAPLPRVQKAGIAGVQLGVAYALNHPAEVICGFDANGNCVMGNPNACQPGDIVHFSWLRISWENGWPWVNEGGRWVTAGDHVGFFHSWANGSTMNTVEGNTSLNGSQDNGGAVLQRTRPTNVVAVVWRPAVYSGLAMPTGPLVPAINTGGQPPSSYLEGMPMPALVRADEAGTIVAIDGVFYRRKKSMEVVNAELAAGVYAHADLNTPRPGILNESIDIESILWAINTGANNTDRTIQLVSSMAADNQRMAAESQRTAAAIVNAVQGLQQAVAAIQVVGGGGPSEPVVVPSAEETAKAVLAALIAAASGKAA